MFVLARNGKENQKDYLRTDKYESFLQVYEVWQHAL